MKTYQGTPIAFRVNVKDGEEYLPSLEGMDLEAIITDSCGNIVKGWSTEAGTITIGTEEVSGETRGYAAFVILGAETARMGKGTYGFELAEVTDDGRTIGVASAVIEIETARIKKGIA